MHWPELIEHQIQFAQEASREDVLEALRASSRISLIRMHDGLEALNSVKELMADIERPRDNIYEVALWEDLVTVRDNEAFYTCMVDNQSDRGPSDD